MEAARASKVAEKKKADQIRKEDLMPGMKKDIDKGIEHVIKLSNTRLKEILFFYFGWRSGGMKKADMIEKIHGLWLINNEPSATKESDCT